MSTKLKPVFRKQKDDGSEEDILEEELYRYTRNRWLSNEFQNLAMRYRKFNTTALIDAAVSAAGNGARSFSEPFFQHIIPRMLLPVGSQPVDEPLDAPSEDFSARKNSNKTISLLDHYQTITIVRNEQRNDVFSFRHALIDIVSRWKHVTPATTPCPVQFSREELELHGSELELVEGLGEVLRQLQNDNLIPLGGMVPREDYEQVSHINNHVRETFVNLAESEQQRALYSQIWPYQGRER